jgi:hypothetical protein
MGLKPPTEKEIKWRVQVQQKCKEKPKEREKTRRKNGVKDAGSKAAAEIRRGNG